MNACQFMLSCLVVLAMTHASATSDASLYSANSEYSIDQFIGGASFVDSCTLLISPFNVKGNVKPIYVPSGAENAISSLYKSSDNQLDFSVERHGSVDTMSITLPNCNNEETTSTATSALPKTVGVWCERCSYLQNTMLATGIIDSDAANAGTIVLVIDDEQILLPQSRRSRSLLQMTSSGCQGPLTVGSASASFANCVSLTPEFELYFTLIPFGTRTTFKGGLWAKNSQFYSSFGFSPNGGMIGADAVIVYPDTASSTGASVTGITMNSYNVAQLNADKGNFPLADTSAAINPDGSISATFTVELPTPPNQLKSNGIGFVYVNNGPMLPNNVLGDHTKNARGGTFGANMLSMTSAVVGEAGSSSTPTATPAAAAATPTVTPTPVPAAVVPTPEPVAEPTPMPEHEHDHDHEGTATTLPSETTPATTDPASTDASKTSTCSVTIAGTQKSFEACYPAKVGGDMQVYYTYEADPLDSRSSILHMAMKSTWNGYLGVGFPSRPGSMTNAAAAIVKPCSTCPSGASIEEYYMRGTNTADVQPSTQMNMSDFSASLANGILSGSFKVKLPGTAATARRRLLATSTYPATAYPLIYAAGPMSSSGVMLSHTSSNDAAGYLDLLNGLPGSFGGGVIDPTIDQSDAVMNAHMWCAAISWGFLIPMAIIMSRYFKPHTQKWFAIHRATAITGFLLAIAALILGFDANNGWETNYPVHRNLGITCTVLGLVQMFAVINKFRPEKDHKHRPLWFFCHAWIGRTAVILAIANIYYGIINVAELGTWAWAVYTAVLAAIVLLGLVMEVINFRIRKNSVASASDINGMIMSTSGKKMYDGSNTGPGGDGYSAGVSTESTSRQDSRLLSEIELN